MTRAAGSAGWERGLIQSLHLPGYQWIGVRDAEAAARAADFFKKVRRSEWVTLCYLGKRGNRKKDRLEL